MVDASAWVKPLKMRARFSGAMPMPVSRTANSSDTWPEVCASTFTDNTTSPWPVNLMALPPRLMSTCRSRMASPTSCAGRAGSMSNSTSTGLAPAFDDRITDRSRSSWSMAKECGSSTILPASTLLKSRMSFSSSSSERAAPSVLLA